MTEPSVPMKPNMQILEEASAWFVEMREGELSLASRERFSRWLRASPQHVRAYLAVSSTFDYSGGLARTRTGDAQALIDRARAQSNVVSLRVESAGSDGSQGVSAEPTAGLHNDPGQLGCVVAEDTAATIPELQESSRNILSFWRKRKTPGPRHVEGNAGQEREQPRRFLTAAAAALVLGFGGLSVWSYLQRGVYSTDIAEQRVVNLADGSSIVLNAKSRIRVRIGSHERLVDLLEGQALFDVAKDARRPFIVRTDATRVRAVGTHFDVNRQATNTVVSVLDGRVAVYSSNKLTNGASGEVSPPNADRQLPSGSYPDVVTLYASAGEQVIVTGLASVKPVHPNIAAATAWRRRKLIFSFAALPDVVESYNRYHDKPLVIADSSLSDLKISAVLSADDPTSLVAFLRAHSSVEVDERDGEILLVRK